MHLDVEDAARCAALERRARDMALQATKVADLMEVRQTGAAYLATLALDRLVAQTKAELCAVLGIPNDDLHAANP